MAEPVDRGRVDPVDPGVQPGVNGGDGIVIVLRPPPECPVAAAYGPRANPDTRDRQVAVAKFLRFQSFGSPLSLFTGRWPHGVHGNQSRGLRQLGLSSVNELEV